MISNKNKRLIAISMLKDLKDKIKKEELIDWFIERTERGSNISSNEISVKDLIDMAKNIGIEVIV